MNDKSDVLTQQIPQKHQSKRVSTAGIASTLALALLGFVAVAANATKPDALLQIDLNRAAVIEKITTTWKTEIPAAQFLSFKEKLAGLRADQLLAATLSGSFDGVLEVMSSHEAAQKRIAVQSLNPNLTATALSGTQDSSHADRSKALGALNSDLVYTPINTCRFVETRNVYANTGGIAHFGAGPFAANEERSYALGTACSLPAGVAAIVGQVLGQATAGAGANLEATQSGGPFGGGVTLVAANSPIFTGVSTPIAVNATNNAIGLKVTANSAHVVIDITGYFKAPGGIIGDITEIQTAAGSGLTGGVTSGAANLALASTFKLPQTCANQQVAKFNTGSGLWECQNDLQGTGGGGTGTVTNIATGSGLAGGPITSTGTISADTNFLQRRVSASCAVGSSIRAIAADGTVTCQTDSAGPTNAWTQGGNAFGAPGIIGTTDAQNLTVRSGGGQVSLLANSRGDGLRINEAVGSGVFISANVVNGHTDNIVTTGIAGATIGGGGGGLIDNPGIYKNQVTGNFGTVSGGLLNEAGSTSAVGGGSFNKAGGGFGAVAGGQTNETAGAFAAVGGGQSNLSSGSYSVVGGGGTNSASGEASTVAGGSANRAAGSNATVPGGRSNTASGIGSFAAGIGARTQSSAATPVVFDGAFVWSDSNSGGATQNFHAVAEDEFAARARGGVRLVTGVDAAGLPTKTFSIAATTGDVVAPNIVTAGNKFATTNNFPAGINTKNIGDRFRDNSIVAWGRVPGTATTISNQLFGVISVTKTAVGAYTIVLDNTVANGSFIITPEIDTQPTSAATIRIASVNTSVNSSTFNVWMNNGLGAPVDNDFMFIVTGR